MKIILIGAGGRMGQTVLSIAAGFQITPIGREEPIDPFLEDHDVVLDFSTEGALVQNLPKIVLNRKPVVIGITGLSKSTLDLIQEAKKMIPIFLSPNFSEGIALIKKLIPHLPEGSYRVEEVHHVHKKDSPSGTALDLAKILPNEPEIFSKREGSVVGTHKIVLSLEFEKVEIYHEVFDRKAFAKGALLACTFLSNKPTGLYTSIYDECSKH